LSSLFIIALPIALIVIGILLNSFYIVHDQPEFSLEEDPVHKLAAERRANYRFFQLQRVRTLKRQKRVGQYGWLVLAAVIASSGLLYSYAVKATTVSKQISAIQTFAADNGKDAVLSLTLSDGSNIQYLVKPAEQRHVKTTDEKTTQAIHGWQLTSLGTAVNVGDAAMPLGMALRITN
jgi:hypothetical protein